MTLVLHDLDDVKRLLRSAPPIGDGVFVIDDATGDMSVADATEFMEEQESIIIGLLKFTPIDPIEKIFQAIATRLSAYEIFLASMVHSDAVEIPDMVERWRTLAEGWLDGILNNKIFVQGKLKVGRAGGMWSSEYKPWFKEDRLIQSTDPFNVWHDLDHTWILESTQIITLKETGVFLTLGIDYDFAFQAGQLRPIEGGKITAGVRILLDYVYRPARNIQRPVPSVDASDVPLPGRRYTPRRF